MLSAVGWGSGFSRSLLPTEDTDGCRGRQVCCSPSEQVRHSLAFQECP